MPQVRAAIRPDPSVGLARIPFGASAEEVSALVARDGGVILTGALTPSEVDAVNRDLDAVMGPMPQGNFASGEDNYLPDFMGAHTKRLQHCVKYSATYRDRLLASETLADYVAALVPGRPGTHSLFSTQAIEIHPGETAQVLHRDGGGFMERLGLSRPDSTELVINSLLALTDVTEEMGATRVVPGSHLWPDFSQRPDPDASVPALLRAGDLLLFSGKLLHGGGANVTKDRSRRVVASAWSLSFLTPEEAWPFVLSVDEVRTYPRRLQAYLGFHSFTYRDEEPGFLWRVDNKPLEQHLGL